MTPIIEDGNGRIEWLKNDIDAIRADIKDLSNKLETFIEKCPDRHGDINHDIARLNARMSWIMGIGAAVTFMLGLAIKIL